MKELQYLITGESTFYDIPRLRGRDIFSILLHSVKALRAYQEGTKNAFQYIASIPTEKMMLDKQRMYIYSRHVASWAQTFVNMISRRALCLERSVAVCAAMRSLGIPAEVVVARRAAANSSQTFEFHAWVEVDKIPINDTIDNPSVFVELFRVPNGEESS